MAIRIPTYERHVQLDAAAQTIPRFRAIDDMGKALQQAGHSITQVAAHWKQKQDQFDRMQMHQNVTLMNQQIQAVMQEELLNFDPGRDRPGTYHERVQQRVNEIVTKFKANAPPGLSREYTVYGNTAYEHSSTTAAHNETQRTNTYVKGQLDGIAGDIYKSLQSNPDGHKQAIEQMKQAIKDYDKLGGLTTAQQRIMLDGYMQGIAKATVKGFQAQGRNTEAKDFIDNFVKDREAEQPRGSDPSGRPTQTPGKTSGLELNANRLAQIEKNPEVSQAIEKAAAKWGVDSNTMKVLASIESSGDPKAGKGDHQGLFSLTKVQFGMGGTGGDIKDPEANADAMGRMLSQSIIPQLTEKLGRDPTAADIFLAHNQGVGGYLAHLQNPDQPAWRTMLATREGQEKGERWAKDAIAGNVPGDVLRRLFGGDATRVTSRDLVALQGTRMTGGSVDQAIADAKDQPPPGQPRQVVASLSGDIISDSGTGSPPGTNAGRPMGNAVIEAQGKEAAIRKGNISDQLLAQVNWAANKNGLIVKVVSGGQPATGVQGVDRTGSHRHDEGGAADIQLFDKNDPTKKLDMRDTIDQQRMYGFIRDAASAGVTGVGGSERYMGPHTLHVGGGTPAVWGAKGERPPQWITAAYTQGTQNPLSPEQKTSELVVPVRTADASGVTVPPGLSRWQQLGNTLHNQVDAGSMKASAIQASMKHALTNILNSDIRSMQKTGQGTTLPAQLQDYYKTKELTFDFVSNKLGTDVALKWQTEREHAEKFYGATAHMEEMPRDVINERLASIAPQPGSPNYIKEERLFKEASTHAQNIFKARYSDPAEFVNQLPGVKAAYDKFLKNPSDMGAVRELIEARRIAQEQLQIPESLRTPITKQEAAALGAPLFDKTALNSNVQAKQVVDRIMQVAGDDPALQQQILRTVLKQKGINQEQAQATASALIAANRPPPAPLTPDTKAGTEKGAPFTKAMGFNSKDGYFEPFGGELGGLTRREPGDLSASEDAFVEPGSGPAGFQAGTHTISGPEVKALLNGQISSEDFDTKYGAGASQYFKDQLGKLQGGGDHPLGAQPPPTPGFTSQKAEEEPPIAAPIGTGGIVAPDDEDTTDTGDKGFGDDITGGY